MGGSHQFPSLDGRGQGRVKIPPNFLNFDPKPSYHPHLASPVKGEDKEGMRDES